MEIASDSDKEFIPSDYEDETVPAGNYGAGETSVFPGSSHYPYYGNPGPAHPSLNSAPNFPHSMYYASFYPPPSAMSSNDASGYEVEVSWYFIRHVLTVSLH